MHVDFYLQLWCDLHGIDPNLAFYTVRPPSDLPYSHSHYPADRHPERGLNTGPGNSQHTCGLLRRAERRHPYLTYHGRARLRHVRRHEHARHHNFLDPVWVLFRRM